jgi:hypothetical protein
MKIRIEHESAKTTGSQSCPAIAGQKGTVSARDSMILPFEMEHQERSRWCWAAIAVSMARFYDTGRWRQCDVASRVFGAQGFEGPENANLHEQWNQNRSLDEALQIIGCFSHWSPGKPPFERVAAELDSGRPFGIRIEWRAGGAHYVVIFGYHGSHREIHIADPQHGIFIQSFDSFPHGYQTGGAIWTENFWTHAGNDMETMQYKKWCEKP